MIGKPTSSPSTSDAPTLIQKPAFRFIPPPPSRTPSFIHSTLALWRYILYLCDGMTIVSSMRPSSNMLLIFKERHGEEKVYWIASACGRSEKL